MSRILKAALVVGALATAVACDYPGTTTPAGQLFRQTSAEQREAQTGNNPLYRTSRPGTALPGQGGSYRPGGTPPSGIESSR